MTIKILVHCKGSKPLTIDVNAIYAFSLYGYDFYCHKSLSYEPPYTPHPKYYGWVISEFTTSAVIFSGRYRETRKSVIQQAREKLLSITEDEFKKKIKFVIGSIKEHYPVNQ